MKGLQSWSVLSIWCCSKYCDKLVKGAHVDDLLQLMNDSNRITLSICMLKGFWNGPNDSSPVACVRRNCNLGSMQN